MRRFASLIGLIALFATGAFSQKSKTDSVVTRPPVHGPDNHGHALRGTVDSVNLVSIALFGAKALWLTVALYAVFAVLSVAGWRAWARLEGHVDAAH